MSDSEKEPEYVSFETMVREDNESEVKIDSSSSDIFSVLGEKEHGNISKERSLNRKKYSKRFKRAPVKGRKTTKYTLKLYDHEYEILKNQAKQLNITIQFLFDIIVLDGFIKRDKRVVDFVNERVKEELLGVEHRFNKIEQFSNLEMDEIVQKIESVKGDD